MHRECDHIHIHIYRELMPRIDFKTQLFTGRIFVEMHRECDTYTYIPRADFLIWLQDKTVYRSDTCLNSMRMRYVYVYIYVYIYMYFFVVCLKLFHMVMSCCLFISLPRAGPVVTKTIVAVVLLEPPPSAARASAAACRPTTGGRVAAGLGRWAPWRFMGWSSRLGYTGPVGLSRSFTYIYLLLFASTVSCFIGLCNAASLSPWPGPGQLSQRRLWRLCNHRSQRRQWCRCSRQISCGGPHGPQGPLKGLYREAEQSLDFGSPAGLEIQCNMGPKQKIQEEANAKNSSGTHDVGRPSDAPDMVIHHVAR